MAMSCVIAGNALGGRREDITYFLALIEYLRKTLFGQNVGTGGSQQEPSANDACSYKRKIEIRGRQGSPVSCLAQAGIAAAGKGVRLINIPPYDRTGPTRHWGQITI